MSDSTRGKPRSIVYGPFQFPILDRELIARFDIALLRRPPGFAKIKHVGKAAALRVDPLPAVSFLRNSP